MKKRIMVALVSLTVLTDVAYINMAPEYYTAITNSGELCVGGDKKVRFTEKNSPSLIFC